MIDYSFAHNESAAHEPTLETRIQPEYSSSMTVYGETIDAQ